MMAPAVYDRIGRGYDTTRRADPRIVGRLLHHLRLEPGACCLDLACGTGNYTLPLRRAGLLVIGLDLSCAMLSEARIKCQSLPLVAADAGSLPFSDACFDGAVCSLAVHHFQDLPRVFSEVRRIMTAGRFVIFTATAEQMHGYWLNEYFPQAMARSVEEMPALDAMKDALGQAGFRFIAYEPWFVSDDLEDFFLYSGKHRPELYLDAGVRRGISTFASLANPEEVAAGLERLRRDIASGRIDEIIAGYENDRGDYGFAVAEACG